jgi:hypothetical protein
MSLTLEQLQQLADQADLRYFVDPKRALLLLGARGLQQTFQITLALEDDGLLLQFRTIDNLHCPADHPHLSAVLKVLGAVNYRMRLLKLGWDPSDGEIVAYADLVLMDGTLGVEQLKYLFHGFFAALDAAHRRVKQTLETGEDPGDEDRAAMLRRALDELGQSLPPAMRELLEKLRGAETPERGEDDPGLREI